MKSSKQILLIGSDPSLPEEIGSALRDLPGELQLVLHTERELRRGIEHAVNRNPAVVIIDLGDKDLSVVRRAAMEINAAAADRLVIVCYHPQVLGDADQSAPALIELMRANVSDFLRRPASTSEFEEILRRHFKAADKEASSRGRLVSFLGNKGGVGKSTMSLSVACSLARNAPDRVLLVDGSLQHGATCELLDLVPEATLRDAALQIDRLDERLLRMLSVAHESGLRVLAAPSNAIDAAVVDDEVLARILAVARQAFDYVIVDTFPVIDSITVAVLDVADLAYVVLNNLMPAVLGTAELFKVLDRLGVADERVRVVLNHSQSGFRGALQPADVAEGIGKDIDHVVPYTKQVLAATNTGTPFVMRAPRWRGFGKAVQKIEREIVGWNAQGLGIPRVSLSELEGSGQLGHAAEDDPQVQYQQSGQSE